MRTSKRLFLASLLFWLCAVSAHASFLTIKTDVQQSGNVTLVTITNAGDEPAYDVQTVLDAFGIETESSLQEILGVNSSFQVLLQMHSADVIPGTYPMIVTTHYSDANKYPFSAVSAVLIGKGDKTRANLALVLPSIELSGEKKLKFEIKNMDDHPKQVNARIIASKELSVTGPESIDVPGKSAGSVSFKIKDIAARPGSNYAVFAIAEFEHNGKHYAAIMPTHVKIVPSLGIPTYLLMSSLAAFIALFVIYKVRRRNN
jgi:hypothetical protein